MPLAREHVAKGRKGDCGRRTTIFRSIRRVERTAMQKTADMVLCPHMSTHDVTAVIRRVLTWPAAAQKEAVASLRALEEGAAGGGDYHATLRELAAIDDADRSGVATEDEVESAFRSFHTV